MKIKIAIFCIFLVCPATSIFKPLHSIYKLVSDGVETTIYNAMDIMINTGQIPAVLKSGILTATDAAKCISCVIAVRLFIVYRQQGMSTDRLDWFNREMCALLAGLHTHVCNGIVQIHKPMVNYIVDNKPNIDGKQFCSLLLQETMCAISDKERFHVNIAGRSITQHQQKKYSKYHLRIAHFTDIHYDEEYLIDGNTQCGEPVCCGTFQGSPPNRDYGAGAWGDYRHCDIPIGTLISTLEEIRDQNVDYVYFTGDIINHRIWTTKRFNNILVLKTVYKEMRKILGNITVYPILGNHEPHPLNIYPPDEVQNNDELSIQWLFDLVAKEWSAWLPADTKQTIRKGGYYTVLVKPGFRIIALNNNVAYTYNLWLAYYKEDPYGQLQWFSDTLDKAEKANEMVHLLAHLPSSESQTHIQWSKQFNKILQRYHHIIAAQFNGHTHSDEMTLYYSKENPSMAINIAFNAGSVTTWLNVNPMYRIYEVNTHNFMVEDYDEWIFNLTEANKKGKFINPRWFKLYSFKDAWDVKDMTNYNELDYLVINRIIHSNEGYSQYWRYKYRLGDPQMAAGINNEEVRSDVCRLVSSVYGEHKKCKKFLKGKYAFSGTKKWFGII